MTNQKGAAQLKSLETEITLRMENDFLKNWKRWKGGGKGANLSTRQIHSNKELYEVKGHPIAVIMRFCGYFTVFIL